VKLLHQRIVSDVILLAVTLGLAALAVETRAAEKVARVGVVHAVAAGLQARGFPSLFWERLAELGWVKGKNLSVEELTAAGEPERFPQLMKEMLARHVDVIVTSSTPAALAAKNATSTVPIVITSMGDPVGAGLVASLARPGGNITGLSTQATDGLPGKWLELMREALPGTSSVGVICVFHAISITDSTAIRSLIPPQPDRRFHGNPIIDSTAIRSLIL
jgi:putative tryptophan/tyrosine transport system substrate-binding protein